MFNERFYIKFNYSNSIILFFYNKVLNIKNSKYIAITRTAINIINILFNKLII